MLDDEEVEFVQIRRRPNAERCLHVQPVRRAGQSTAWERCVPEARCAGAALSSVLQVQDGPRTDLTGRKERPADGGRPLFPALGRAIDGPAHRGQRGQAGARAAIRRCDRGLQRRHPGGVSGQGAGAGGVTGYRAESSVDWVSSQRIVMSL